MRLDTIAYALVFAAMIPSMALAQDANDSPSLQATRWPALVAAAPAPQRAHLEGTAVAFSVAGDLYQIDGHRLRLPGAIDGWEDDIELGVGVFRAIGEFGHYGAGVGLGEDDDVALRAHVAMRW